MSVNLKRAMEVDNGYVSDGVVLPDSIFEQIRSAKPTYSGDVIVAIEYYNSLTQTDPNRIARSVFTYTDDFISTQTNYYYNEDGVTLFSIESMTYIYSGDNIIDIEVT